MTKLFLDIWQGLIFVNQQITNIALNILHLITSYHVL